MRVPIGAWCFFLALAGVAAGFCKTARIVLNPGASYVDVRARRAELQLPPSERVRAALQQLKTCSGLEPVNPPGTDADSDALSARQSRADEPGGARGD